MTDLVLADRAAEWRRLKSLVLDSVSSPITRRVYSLGLDEFFAWYTEGPRPGFTKATVAAWRVSLEARGLGAVSINVRITAVRKLAVEAADNGLLAPELATGITRVKGVASKGARLGNWLSGQQAQKLLNAPDATTAKGLRDRAISRGAPRLRAAAVRSCGAHDGARPAEGRAVVHRGPRREARARSDGSDADLGQSCDRRMDRTRRHHRWPCVPGGKPAAANFQVRRSAKKSSGNCYRGMRPQSAFRGLHPMICGGRALSLCRAAGGELEQIQLLLGPASVQTTERYLGTKQDLVHAPNDGIKLGVAV
jgi:hypothetical protein